MKVDQLRALVAVSRAGSFRRAADAAGVSQATLSRSIAALEAELGVELLSRTSQGIALTSAGKRILDRAETVLADLERLSDEARHLRGDEPGDLRIALSPFAALVLLPRALRGFRRAYPTGTLEVHDAFYPEVLPALRDGAYDLAIVARPPEAEDPGITSQPLADLRVVVATCRDNPAAGARDLASIAAAPWLSHGPLAGPSGLFELPIAGTTVPTCLTRTDSFSTLFAVMHGSNAFCFLSDRLLEEIGGRFDLVRVPVTDPMPRYELALLTRNDPARKRSALLLMDLLARQAQGLGEPLAGR